MSIIKIGKRDGNIISPYGAEGNKGVWSLKQAYEYIKQGTWPVLDPYWQYVSLLLSTRRVDGGQNNTFLDSSSNNFTITRNGNTTQGTFSPFSLAEGEWSNFFDGSGDYLQAPDNVAFQIGTGNFTFEAWINLTTLPSDGNYFVVASKYHSANPCYFMAITNTSGTLSIQFGGQTSLSGNYSFSTGVWYHVAAVRNGASTTIYVNGQSVVSGSYTDNAVVSGIPFRIGVLQSTLSNNFFGYFNGCISNVRLIKGTAVYTSAFTPPTTPLTAITNTSLLTCQSNRFKDNSSNAFTVTRNGDVRVAAVSPFIPNEAYSPSVNGGSGYFDGSGDYLSVASNAAFDLGTGDFTFDLWVYKTKAGGAHIIHGTTAGFIVNIDASEKIVIRLFGVADRLTSAQAIQLNAWNHIAVARSGTTLSMWINGSRANGGTVTNSDNFGQTGFNIGAPDTNIAIYGGYFSNLRLVKGSAVYDPTSTTITVPTIPATAVSGTSLLCNFTNANIFDSTGKNNLETVGNAQISTAQSKFGGASAAFDGTGDYLETDASSALQLGGGDFTIEAWVRFTSLTNATVARTAGGNGFDGLLFFHQSGGGLYVTSTGTSWDMISEANAWTGCTTNTWHHLALTRSGNVFTAFRDGTQTFSTTASGSIYQSANIARIGAANSDGSFSLNGYIDDLRITKGVARYGNFTPPTQAFPNSVAEGDDYFDNVSLLLHMDGTNGSTTFTDSSSNAHTVTANGNAQVSTAQSKFGGASAAFDGTGDYLSIAGSSAFSSTGDLTIEAWCYIRSASAFGGIFSLRNSTNGYGASINILNNGNFDFNIAGVGGGQFITHPVSLNQWLHVALVRSGSSTDNCTCYVNGTQVGQFTSTAEANAASNTAVIGRYYANGTNQYFVDGYIDDVRYTPGIARYDGSFTPPQRQFRP